MKNEEFATALRKMKNEAPRLKSRLGAKASKNEEFATALRELKMKNGERKMKNEEWRMKNGELRVKNEDGFDR